MKKPTKKVDSATREDYFSGCESPDEIRARFKEHAKRLHPDAGGDPEKFVSLVAARDEALLGDPDLWDMEDGA